MGKRRKWGEMDKSAIPLAKLRKAFEVYNQTTGKSPSTYRWLWGAKITSVLAQPRIGPIMPAM